MFYVNHKVITKQKLRVDPLKTRKGETEYTTMENNQLMKVCRDRKRNNENTKQPESN